MGIEPTTFILNVKHLIIEPSWMMIEEISKQISIPNMFALGLIGKQTLTVTFYLSEIELILGQTPSSAIKTFQFPF